MLKRLKILNFILQNRSVLSRDFRIYSRSYILNRDFKVYTRSKAPNEEGGGKSLTLALYDPLLSY